MTSTVRNRLLALGVLWGLLLAAVPALLMTDPYQLTGFLVAGLACAALSGSLGTLVAGRRAVKKGGERSSLLVGVLTGALQGLAGGIVAALLIWALMAITLSGFTLRNPVELSVLMSPRVFLGSFFVALSTFAYALVGGVLLGPIFGTLINRTVRAGNNVSGEKEDLIVR
ncbi:MAG TPA: hypothetical protein VF558_07450 [Rubrobacteraceae bacterium]|jgi:hypothetical protein